MSIHNEIKQREGIPLDFDRINFITGFGSETHLCVFDDDLAKLSKIETADIFKDRKFAVMLVSQKDAGINHWVCLIKNGGEIYFFDSLGNSPEKLFQFTHEPSAPFLNWMKRTGVKFYAKKLQAWKANVQDCGIHVAIRIVKHALDPQQYYRWVKSAHLDPDFAISLLGHISLLRFEKKHGT